MKSNKTRVLAGRGARFVAALLLVTIPVLSLKNAAATANSQLYLGPSSQSVTKGSNITVTLNMSSNGNAAFAWQAYLSYPTAYFDSASVATSGGSPFTMTAGTDATSGGTVSLTRFATTSHAYDGAVAIITLHSNGTAGNASVSLQHICANSSESTNCSAIVDGNGSNLLGSIAGASISLTSPAVSSSGGSSGTTSSSGGATTTGTTKKAAKAATGAASSSAGGATAASQGVAKSTVFPTSDTEDSSSTIGLTVLVVDQHNKPIAHAQVTVDGVTVYTDKSGRAILTSVSPGASKAVVRYKGQQKVLPLELQTADQQGNQTAKVAIQTKKSSVLMPISAGIGALIIIALVAFLLIDHGHSVRSLFKRRNAPKSSTNNMIADQDARFSASPQPHNPPPTPAPLSFKKPEPSQKQVLAAKRVNNTLATSPADMREPTSAAARQITQRPAPVSRQAAALARQRAMQPGTIIHPGELEPQSSW